ncbi:MAG: HAMP domain-containing histidine kinase [Acidobacteria bacterium]|nr:HAMP domain-containing histidine kinase [Acidobacteriota bacterium]
MRKWSLDHPRLWLVLMIAACLSLVPLAWLQYRWIAQISAADRERRQVHLGAAVSRFVRDLDGEAGRALRLLLFGPMGGPRRDLPGGFTPYLRFLEAGGEPHLVKNFYLSQGGTDGTLELLQIDLTSGETTPVAWPPELDPLRARLALLSQSLEAGPSPPQPPFDGQALAFFAPRWQGLPPRILREARPPRVFPPVLTGWTIVQLDQDFIAQELLPELVKRHFQDSGVMAFQVCIVSQREAGHIVYATDASLDDEFFASPDLSAPLLSLRPDRPPGLREPGPGRAFFAPPWRRQQWQPSGPGGPDAGEPEGVWRLLVRHRAGSLEAAVGRTRRRNLAVSLAILLLMSGSLAVLLVSTRRAQKLARMQMEFVAGVSHELKTPLSVICSAGDNLADGLVAGEQQVRRYGAVVRGEGRRLSRMVDKILGFAGIQSGHARYEMEPVEVSEVVAAAVAACEPEIRAAGCTLETTLEQDLPPILADSVSLTHCLRNLIDNALAHGGEGKWIGVRARAVGESQRRELEIAVEDRGRGIEPRDLARIFDPFYRGGRAVQDQVRGFGLGLTLARRIAEAHSGALSVENVPGQGARFIVRIPALAGFAAEEENGTTDPADRG